MKTYTFDEAAKELGYKNGGGVSVMLQTCGIHVKRECVMPTDGKGHRVFTEAQVQALKAIEHKKGKPITESTKRKVRAIIYGKAETLPLLNEATISAEDAAGLVAPKVGPASPHIVMEPKPAELKSESTDVVAASRRSIIRQCAVKLASLGQEELSLKLLEVE